MDDIWIWLVVYLPLWKIWKLIGIFIPNIWKKKKCSKPPTSIAVKGEIQLGKYSETSSLNFDIDTINQLSPVETFYINLNKLELVEVLNLDIDQNLPN